MRYLFGKLRLGLALAVLVAASPVHAETIVAALSSPRVSITSNFTGAEVVVFGTVERDAGTVARGEPYVLAIEVKGPPETVVTRRKERFFGIWVNGSSATYANVPSFYAVHLSAPLEDMALPQVLQKEQVGLEYLHLAEIETADSTSAGDDDFREAFLRLRERQGLYSQEEGTVEFLSRSLFRTTIPLPAIVPDGDYEMTVYLFRGGGLLTKESRPLSIAKSGFEQFTYSFAHNHSLLYGIVTVLLAAFTGWAASIIFRKD